MSKVFRCLEIRRIDPDRIRACVRREQIPANHQPRQAADGLAEFAAA